MTFRSRLLMAFTGAALLPVAILAIGARARLRARLVVEYEQRVDAIARVAREDIMRESGSIASSLEAIARGLGDDAEFRAAAVRGDAASRRYLLDFATHAMQVTQLSMLQLEDSAGRILSSGHFRNEYDRLDGDALRLLTAVRDTAVLMRVRAPEGPMLAIARADSARVGGKLFYLVGGISAETFLARARRGDSVDVRWDLGDTSAHVANTIDQRVPVKLIDNIGEARLSDARLVVAQSLAELDALQRELNQLFLISLATMIAAIVALAIWLSARLNRPLEDLARATTRIELDGADVAIPAQRDDEIGAVARRLQALVSRLRISAGKLREAERRATVGDMARQVNHDIKNGLIPIRNVLRHLGDVAAVTPDALAPAFTERRATLDASIEYLDTLARNYARLTPRSVHEAIDVNDVVRRAVASAGSDDSTVQLQLADALPPVNGDGVVMRRIVDNLIRNAIESFDGGARRVTVTTARSSDAVIVTVEDTGRGMSPDELARAFDDFYTTKTNGTGLGLSVVRRLTADLNGTVQVDSAPGRGTRFTLEFPVR